MKRKRLLLCILAVLLLTSLFAGNMPETVSAEGSSSAIKEQLDGLQQQKDELQQQIDKLEGKITENRGQIQAIAAEKSVIDQEVFLLHQQITNINEQIDAYGVLIADKQKELVEAQAKLDRLSELNKDRIRAMEENGPVTYWSVIFRANSFADLLDRLNMIEEIAASDRRRLQEMSDAAKVVSQAKEVLETEKAALEATKQELADTQMALEEKRKEADALLQQLMAKGAEFESMLDQSESDQSALMEKIAKQEAAYENAKYQEWLATSVPETTVPPTTGSTGNAGAGNTVEGVTWQIPINYTYFSSPFGYRDHPLHGDWRFHYGVDLAAPTGTPIYATRSGVVTTTDYEDGGAGYYVSINHGDGYSSIYMHMTHYIVTPGQYVSAGQVIGYCGSTGGSTGPHLHFGISYNGVYVNPADYINI